METLLAAAISLHSDTSPSLISFSACKASPASRFNTRISSQQGSGLQWHCISCSRCSAEISIVLFNVSFNGSCSVSSSSSSSPARLPPREPVTNTASPGSAWLRRCRCCFSTSPSTVTLIASRSLLDVVSPPITFTPYLRQISSTP